MRGETSSYSENLQNVMRSIVLAQFFYVYSNVNFRYFLHHCVRAEPVCTVCLQQAHVASVISMLTVRSGMDGVVMVDS